MLRSHLLAALVLVFSSWNASAQARSLRPVKGSPQTTVQYGSRERTKLLQQAYRGRGEDVARLGAANRRSLLTTGKPIYKTKPERRYHR
jgi:hypothetical protein